MARHIRIFSFLATGAAAVLGACNGAPALQPGNDFSGHEIVSSEDLGGGCQYITYQVEPEWSCTEEQLTRVQAVYGEAIYENGGGYYGDVASVGIAPTYPGSVPPPEPVDFEEAVKQKANLNVSSCEDIAELQREALRETNQTFLENQTTAALTPCLPVHKSTYVQDGQEVDYCTAGDDDYLTDSADGGFATGTSGGDTSSVLIAPSDSSEDGASEYSTTNNQVVGVEEADYVKNDAGHVFVLTAGDLRIFDTWPVEDAHEIARVALDAEPRRLLLAGDELVVFQRTSNGEDPYGTENFYDYSGGAGNPSSQGCTYGYDCRFQSEGGSTKIEVYDVSDPANPTLMRGYALSGAYVASRRIGRSVHVVVHNGGAGSGRVLDLLPQTIDAEGPDEVLSIEQELETELSEHVAAIPDEELLPQTTDDQRRTGTCEEALMASGAEGTSVVTLSSFDLDQLGRLERTLVAASPGFVYASTNSLYMATDGISPNGSWYRYYASPSTDISAIHKFSLEGTETSYKGSALVRGHVLNQFAMDEHEDVLRVASTSGWVPDPDVHSTLTTLVERDGSLSRLGELTGLAPTEDIRSVRFDGDRGFVVTFKKTDPLFAFDLSDPAQPAVLGELKIPGFSTYMHPLDQDHILAVGFDTDDQGDFAYFDGIQIQMFDVSDMSNPTLLHKTVIGTRGSGSEALLNHLAFNYFAVRNQLAMPVTLCEGGDEGTYGSTMSFSGLIVFDVSTETGFSERGRMPFADPSQYETYDYGGTGCHQWWTNSTSTVKRSIFFEDYVMALSDYEMRGAHVDAMQDVLANLPLVDGSTDPMSQPQR